MRNSTKSIIPLGWIRYFIGPLNIDLQSKKTITRVMAVAML
jgi:hypothetical protein